MGKIKLLIGSNGCGKSEYIYNYFIENSRNKDGTIDFSKKFYLIVPEQDTASKQKILMEKSIENGNGILNIDVISFDRLSYMVFDELNIDIKNEKMVMDDAKTLLLRLAIINLKKQKVSFTYFNKSINKIGFMEKLTSCMSEFYSYGIDEKIIEEVIKRTDDKNEKQKLSELLIIQKEFLRLIKEKNFFIKEDKLNLLRDKIVLSKLFDNAVVALDGFTGLTPVQMEIFSSIYDKADKVFTTITFRKKEYENYLSKKDAGIFNISAIFIEDIKRMLKNKNVKLDKEDIIEVNDMDSYKYKDREDLDFIEKNIFSEKKKTDVSPNHINIVSAKNVIEEVKYVVSKINELTKIKGYKYDDIKIVVPTLDDYKQIFIKSFYENNLPIYIDDSKNIYASPIVEIIRAVLEIFNTNFSVASVMRYFNCGLFDKNKSDIYFLINNFLNMYNGSGYNFHKNKIFFIRDRILEKYENKKIYESEVDENIEKIVETINKELVNIYEIYEEYKSIKSKTSIKDYVKLISEFLKRENIYEKYELFLDELKNKNGENDSDYVLLKNNIDVIENIFILLSEISSKDEIISIKEFIKLFELSVENMEFKTIPYKLDQVVVGDLLRSRFDNPKILFFLGMNDSKIPKSMSDNNIINDDMRKLFSKTVDIVLSQTTIETALNSRFYVYMTITNPTDLLVLSWTAKNAKEEADFKSSVIRDISKYFESNVEEIVANGEYDDIWNIENAKRFVAMKTITSNNYLSKKGTVKDKINEKEEVSLNAYLLVKSYLDKKYSGRDKSFTYYSNCIKNNYDLTEDKNLNESLLESVKEGHFKGSATSLEKYASCPYKYFINRTIGLRDVISGEMSDIDFGNISHYFMEWLFKKNHTIVRDNGTKKIISGIDLSQFDDEDIEKIVSMGVEENKNKIYKLSDDTEKNKFIVEKVKDTIERTLYAFRHHAKNSEKPEDILVEYNDMNYIINEDGSIAKNRDSNIIGEITGRIDKIELYKENDKVYVRVIDYKSSIKKIDMENIESGIQIQFLLYLDYCINFIKKIAPSVGDKEVIPIGSFYSPVVDGFDIDEDDETQFNINTDMNKLLGIVNKDEESISLIDKTWDRSEKNFKSENIVIEKKSENVMDKDEIISLLKRMRAKIASNLKEIKKGNIKIKPHKGKEDACKYCNYKDICKSERAYSEEEDE